MRIVKSRPGLGFSKVVRSELGLVLIAKFFVESNDRDSLGFAWSAAEKEFYQLLMSKKLKFNFNGLHLRYNDILSSFFCGIFERQFSLYYYKIENPF